MPDYKETSAAGHSWQRCTQVVIENYRGATPLVRFDEERVIVLDGGIEARSPCGTFCVDYDPARPIALRDPHTGELTGETTTYAAAYALLYSAYLDAAVERDMAAAEFIITPPEGI